MRYAGFNGRHTARLSPVNSCDATGGDDVTAMDVIAAFEAERPRLLRLAGRVLNDEVEAQDIVQQAWLRLRRTDQEIASLPAWLTTVTTRLCLDRLRAKVPVPEEQVEPEERVGDPADEVALADTVGVALQVVLDRLTPAERVAFVLHDSFGFEFATIAAMLDTTPAAARKLASRARAKVVQPVPEDALADWEVVDAFLAAARGGDLHRLLDLLAPDVVVAGDAAAVAMGTPERIAGRHDVGQFFNGAAKAALPVFVEDRPGAAWVHLGETKVVFDFTVVDGAVTRIQFRAEPAVLAGVRRRKADEPVHRGASG
jgi:RNA polymerase sigma-70 factor (ECF subfamily)